MTTHVSTPRNLNQPPLPNQPFFSWLRTHTTLFVGQLIGLLSVISVPIALVYYSHAIPTNIQRQTVGHFVIYAHVFFLIGFIAVLIRRLDKNNIGNYRARLVYEKLKGTEADLGKLERYGIEQVARFKRRFLLFWCSMLSLYLIFAVEPVFSVIPADCLMSLQTKWEIIRTELFPLLSLVLNNLSLIFVFSCFSVLYLPSGATASNSEPSVSTPRGDSETLRTWERFMAFMRRIVQKLSRTDLDARELHQRTLVVLFVLAIAAFTFMFPLIMLSKVGEPTNWSEYPAVFDALSGTINAIVLALLVARLDSKLIGLPSWLICILYFYAGVQPMFVVFELHPDVYAGIKTAVLLVVFIFKIYFFLIIFYSLQTGRMFNYFFCSSVLNEHVRRLKQQMPSTTAPQTSSTATAEGKHAEAPIDVTADQTKTEVEQEVSDVPIPEVRGITGFKKLGLAATFILGLAATLNKRLKGAPSAVPETVTEVPETTVEDTSAKHSIEVTAHESPKEIHQDPPPDRKDPRAIWFKRLGLGAIAFFTISLLFYVSLSEDHKLRLDQYDLSHYVISLHVGLLVVICAVVINAWRKEVKSGFAPSYESRSWTRAELRFMLSEPKSLEARARKYEELSKRTNDQFKSFTHYFRLFWIVMLSLYVAMWFSERGQGREDYQSKLCPPVAQTLELNQLTTTPSEPIPNEKAVLANMSKPEAEAASLNSNLPTCGPDQASETKQSKHAKSTGAQVAKKRFSVQQMDKKAKYSFAFFVLNNFMVLILFWCFTVLYIPADDEKFDQKNRLLRNYSLLICVLLTVLVPLLAIIIKNNQFTELEVQKIPTILGAAGGTLNAVAFALLIARLDSRIIGLRLLMVTVLYAYAALQPLFVTFNQPSNLLRFIATSAMITAFIFKISLVLMVGHIRRSGGLVDYLWFFPVLHNSVNSIFGNQFEIKSYSPKPGMFTFSVFNRNVETYRAVKVCSTQAECDDTIRTLVTAMKKRDSYCEQPPLQGTYWIQVKSDDDLLCESIGLTSHAEVDELIDESIEKVPHCKYDRG